MGLRCGRGDDEEKEEEEEEEKDYDEEGVGAGGREGKKKDEDPWYAAREQTVFIEVKIAWNHELLAAYKISLET